MLCYYKLNTFTIAEMSINGMLVKVDTLHNTPSNYVSFKWDIVTDSIYNAA